MAFFRFCFAGRGWDGVGQEGMGWDGMIALGGYPCISLFKSSNGGCEALQKGELF
jgi:hypothetical protein